LKLVNKGGNGSQGDYTRRASSYALGSALNQSGSHNDSSGKAMAKMTYSMGLVLERKDQEIIQGLKKCSIALDERDQILLIFLRVLTKTGQIYECLLGLARDYGTGPTNCLKAIEAVMRQKCTRKHGRRTIPHYDKGEGDKFDAELFNKLRNGNTSIASDSGPTEMKAAFEACPTAKDPANRADPLFPNNRYIFRDAAHRHRSVQQGFWNDLDKPLRDFLSALIDGPHSFAKFVGDSRKFSLYWERTQREMALGTFADVLRNLGYAKQRFDSRSRPLFILFKMLGGPSTYVFMCFLLSDLICGLGSPGRFHMRLGVALGTCSWDKPILGTGPLLGQAHPWDRPTLWTGPFLGQAHSWDRPTLGTGPLLGQALSWDRPILGTGPLLGQAHSAGPQAGNNPSTFSSKPVLSMQQ
jgi:hypothetical protein